jgi:hypothetical protein
MKRIRLSSLMLLVVIVALAIALLLQAVRAERMRRQAEAALRAERIARAAPAGAGPRVGVVRGGATSTSAGARTVPAPAVR